MTNFHQQALDYLSDATSQPQIVAKVARLIERQAELEGIILKRDNDAAAFGSAFVMASIQENGQLKFKNIKPCDMYFMEIPASTEFKT